jgi:hypothetical protein
MTVDSWGGTTVGDFAQFGNVGISKWGVAGIAGV